MFAHNVNIQLIKEKNCFKLELDHTTVPSYIGLALFPLFLA